MMPDISHDTPGDHRARDDADPGAPATTEPLARQQAVNQIERKRRFWMIASVSTVGMIVLTIIWAFTEYHNAGGWPTNGFSQSSGTHDVWNYWIIYPFIAWVFVTVAGGLLVYLRKPISEGQIRHEIERQSGTR